jgi:hypothetical protein
MAGAHSAYRATGAEGHTFVALDIAARIQALDDFTAVQVLKRTAAVIFKAAAVRDRLRASVAGADFRDLENLDDDSKAKMLGAERSVWLARRLLVKLAAEPQLRDILERVLDSFRCQEMIAEASISRGLPAALIRLLAAYDAGREQGDKRGEAGLAELRSMAALTVAPEGAPLPAEDYVGACISIRTTTNWPDPAVAGAPEQTRTAWPHLECDNTVLIGAPFSVEVGLRPDRAQHVGGTGRLTLPDRDCAVGIILIFDPESLGIVEGPRQFTLPVSAADPFPRRNLRMVALAGNHLPEQRDIGVVYLLDGVMIGYASRTVLAKTQISGRSREGAQRFGEIELGQFEADDQADLTIIIKRGDSPGTGRLLFAAASPHFALPIADEPAVADLGSEPAKFLDHVLTTASTSGTPFRLFTALKGIGRMHIAPKLPPAIVSALRQAGSKAAPRAPSVLIVSDDPYIPWEFAVLEPPLVTNGENASSPFLGAQTALGRWILPCGERPSPHPSRHLTVREQAVVTAVYDRVVGWKRLQGAEEEAADLLRQWQGTGRQVDATFDDVLRCLRGQPAVDLLHFALHGQFDAAGDQDGLVLISREPGGTTAASATFLRSDDVGSCNFAENSRSPFVFLNACQVGAAKRLLGDYAGMAASFLFAGASAVVAPLWSIDDAEAHRLALKLYECAWKGEPMAEILRRERARFTEVVAKSQAGSPTYLAYQFFGHPRFTIERAQALKGAINA